ncbi:magnesium transporter [Vibrio sp. UCD-FRSSP16_10]|uniref:magnesium transporter n=1 Tax=unclassified Vibrio TaxID=2614977 RepID=UPI0007FD6567|nr:MULTISPECIES: magnesium transporter [unclassified Vibrio]OBT09435.1 magnesium transporter [Vibrio sp. UCD-FRSSP16_30]OBT22114.1 magnesium transporter [Vibrio sp. UCD-FRSSP16_10]
MSVASLPPANNGKGQRIARSITLVLSYLLKAAIVFGIVAGASIALSFMGSIHGTDLPPEYFSNGHSSIIKLLDSEVFMGFIFFVTVSVVVYVLYLLWQLHEVAVHKASRMSSAHTQIVFALSLCGLFIDKTWWVLAIIIAFTRWDAIGESFSKVIGNGLSHNKNSKTSQE